MLKDDKKALEEIMLAIWIVILIFFMFFLLFNIKLPDLPKALLTITGSLVIVLFFFIKPDVITDEQVVPYFLNSGYIMYLSPFEPPLDSYLMSSNYWSEFLNEGKNSKEKMSQTPEKLEENFLNYSGDLTEITILDTLYRFFYLGWYLIDYDFTYIDSGFEKGGGGTWRFDERKRYTLIYKKEINSKFKENKFIKYLRTGSESFYLPPGTYIYKDKNSIIFRKPFFFKFTIRIEPKTMGGGLDFLRDCYKGVDLKNCQVCLVNIKYKVEFSRLTKGSVFMEYYKKWSDDTIKLLKKCLPDREELKKSYIEKKLLFSDYDYRLRKSE